MRLLNLMGMILLAIAATAKTYYTKPNATGDGTAPEKAGEFTNLVNQLQAGDTLYCMGGQYDYSTTIEIKAAGTKEAMVHIWAADGEKPIFDFRNIDYGKRGIMTLGDYIYVKGLTIRYTGKNGIWHSGSYSKFELLDVYGNGDTGVQMKGGHNNLILNCDSHDNFDYKLGGTDKADFGGNADGFADKLYVGGGNTYRGCRSWNNSDDGWDFYQIESAGYGPTVIEECVCYNNGPGYYNMIGHARYEKDKEWFDQFAGEGITVTDKRGGKRKSSLQNYINLGNANGFKLGGNFTKHDVKLMNSISVNNGKTFNLLPNLGAKGIDQNNNAGTMWICNNTCYNNAKNYGFDRTSCGKAYLYSNLSYKGVRPDVIACETPEQKDNSWQKDIKVTDDDFESLDESLLLAPREADGSLPKTPFLRLKKDSKLNGIGINY